MLWIRHGQFSSACFPVLETLANDLSGFIATNVVSITDGQLNLDTNLTGFGIFPAISLDRSVSRIGMRSADFSSRIVSFRIYALINEYKQECQNLVKTSMFQVRKLRWERVQFLFQQRACVYHFFSWLALYFTLIGCFDEISWKNLRLSEFLIANFDCLTIIGRIWECAISCAFLILFAIFWNFTNVMSTVDFGLLY